MSEGTLVHTPRPCCAGPRPSPRRGVVAWWGRHAGALARGCAGLERAVPVLGPMPSCRRLPGPLANVIRVPVYLAEPATRARGTSVSMLIPLIPHHPRIPHMLGVTRRRAGAACLAAHSGRPLQAGGQPPVNRLQSMTKLTRYMGRSCACLQNMQRSLASAASTRIQARQLHRASAMRIEVA